MIGYKKLERNGIFVDQHYLDAASEKRRYLYITIFFVFGSLLVNGIVHNVQELKWKGYEIAIIVFFLFCYLYMIKDLRKQISFNVYVVVVNFDTSRFIGFFQNMDGDTLFLKRFKTKKRISMNGQTTQSLSKKTTSLLSEKKKMGKFGYIQKPIRKTCIMNLP